MDRNEAFTLRDELNGGQRRLADLSIDDFKGLMYWLLVDRFIASTHQFALSDQYDGHVDVVVVESLDPPHGAVSWGRTERTHFFECNGYGKSFELADLGKLFCAAIRHQPETLALVSTRPIQTQALDYADLFFGLGGRFPRVEFQNLHAEFLLRSPLDREDLPFPEPDTLRTAPAKQDPAQSAEWRLIEHGIFNDRIIASSETAARPVQLVADRRYTLEVRGTLLGQVDPREIAVAISFHRTRSSSFSSSHPPRIHGHDFLARFTLDPRELAPGGEVMLQVHASSFRKTVSSLRLPEMDVAAGVESLLPDARSGISGAASTALRDGNGVITFLSGEAGVGKSYLCSQVAADLKYRHGYQVENFRADSVADGSLFVRVLLRLLTPRFHDANEQDASDFKSRVISEALRCLLREFAPAEVDSLSQAITERDPGRATPDRIVPLLASLFAQSGDILLILQDCHELPPALIAALDALIVALDERGWAGTRMILEYRTGPGTDNPAWTVFVQRVHSTLHSHTQAIHLRNLTQDETDNFLRPLFDAITDELIFAFWSRTGGNPLLLASLLRSLVDTGAVGRPTDDGSGRFHVRHPARILEGRARMAEKPRQILKDRIQLLDATRPRALDSLPSVIPVLAIFALTENLLPPSDVFSYFGLARVDGEKLIRWLTREEILASSDDSPTAVAFTHDLIRDTVKELGANLEETLSVAERIADEVHPEGYPALLRMAQLARYIGDFRLCREYLNLGQEAAKNENRFHWARRFQLQLLDSLQALPNATFRDRLAQLELFNDLGWSEYNSGSNRVAREYYREARALAERLPMGGDWTPQLMRSTLAHLDHRIMSRDLALHDFQAFLASAQRALERVGDPTVLGRIINRLLLGCSALGFVEEGMYFAKTGVVIASASNDPEVNAVLCTDISTFFAPACSDDAVRLAERGTGLAHSARQRMHNEYASMRNRLRARGDIDPPAQREEFHRRLRELGMVVLEGSLGNFEGIVQLVNNNTSDARRLFAQAEIHARLYDQVALEPVIWNNAMVAALLHGDLDAANAHSARLLRFWANLSEHRRLAAPRWSSLIATFEMACNRMAPPSGASTLSIPAAPPFAGGFLPSLVNLVSLYGAGWRTGEPGLEPGVLLADWTGSAQTRLSRSPAVIRHWNGVPLYLDP